MFCCMLSFCRVERLLQPRSLQNSHGTTTTNPRYMSAATNVQYFFYCAPEHMRLPQGFAVESPLLALAEVVQYISNALLWMLLSITTLIPLFWAPKKGSSSATAAAHLFWRKKRKKHYAHQIQTLSGQDPGGAEKPPIPAFSIFRLFLHLVFEVDDDRHKEARFWWEGGGVMVRALCLRRLSLKW